MSELDKLIGAVEAGTLPEAVFHGCSSIRGHWAYTTGLDAEKRTLVFLAYNGSLDAALALHKALLPGWGWARLNDRMAVELAGSIYSARGPCPARAWLIAILRAYRTAQREAGE